MTDGNVALMQPRSEAVFAVSIAIFACASVFVFFRLLSRIWIVRRVSLDDYFILVAWLIAFGLAFSICWGATVGLGRHVAAIPLSWQPSLKRAQYAFSVLYQPALMAEKTSILVFYLTLSQTNRNFRWATIATLVVVNAAGLALTLATIFQCRPFGAAFKYPTPQTAHCTDVVTIYLSSTPVNIITDLAILFLPMPILTGMRLPRKQKVILIVTFGFGIFVAVVDVIRTAYLQSASTYRLQQLHQEEEQQGDTDMTDFSWYASFSFMWSVIEVCIGIMCACVPALKPLVSRFIPHLVHDNGAVTKSSSLDLEHSARMAEDQRVPSIPHAELEAKDFAPHERAEDSAMGMMDFLTMPGMNESDVRHRLHRSQTMLTNTTRDTSTATPTFFDFVNMKGKRCMVQMSNRESIFPISMVTILFFIWGFEYGLLDVLNKQFQSVASMSPAQSVVIHSAYYAGYLAGPLTIGRLVLKHWGFKACYTVGLAIYACGTLIFWPAAVLTSFPTYVVVNILVGMGLSILEVAANPFIALCGPQEYSEIRLNLSQGFQAIGTVVAPLIASKAFTKSTANTPSLINTQWAYLGIALFTILLAVAYYYVPLPEATDEELEDAAERIDGANSATLGNVPIIWIVLGLGVFSQFCYVGAQETVSTTFNTYFGVVEPTLNTTNYMAIAHTIFAVSRFLAAGLGFFITPRILLLFFHTGAIVFSALAMHFTGKTAAALLIMVFFFEGPLFSLIFAQSLRGMGKNTKLASTLVTSAISGGGVFPPMAYAATKNRSAQFSLCVAVAAFCGGTLLPIGLNVLPAARKVVDPVKAKDEDITPAGSTSSRTSRALSFLTPRKKPSTEWRERERQDSGAMT